MSPKTLHDAQASIQDFLNEAKFCAENGKGFAAMCTVFPVILAISEALDPSLKNNELVPAFVKKMTDKQSWIIAPSKEGTSIADEHLAEKLTHLRNALAHVLSQPVDVILVNKIAEVAGNPTIPPDKWIISTTEFVEAVWDTANGLIETDLSVAFDPKPRGSRAPAEGGAAPWGASASGINLKDSYPSTEDWGSKPA